MQEKDRQSLCTGKRIAVILTISILVLATAGMALMDVFAARRQHINLVAWRSDWTE